MRFLLAIALASCAHPRPFAPARVYVVEPCAKPAPRREMDGGRLNLATLRNDSMTEQERGEYCWPSDYQPLVACGGGSVLRYDGCHWACRPMFELSEQAPAHMPLNLGADIEAVQSTDLCASPNYCSDQEAK